MTSYWGNNKKVVYNNEEKLLDALNKAKVKCKCGHVILMIRKSYEICTWCGRKVYRNKKDEFKEMLKKQIKKVE